MNSSLWRERVSLELNELAKKREALGAFMMSDDFSTLSLVHQTLLDTQLSIMKSYEKILAARIREAGGL